MSGKNVNLLDLGYGVNRNNTQYAVGKRWYDSNLVRWHQGMLEPVGGWVHFKEVDGNTLPTGTKPVRDVFSWRDLLKVPYIAFASTDNVQVCKVGTDKANDIYLDVTPTGLVWAPSANSGFGAGFFGAGLYGFTPAAPVDPDAEGQWSFDSWGRELVGVHSQDGRLFEWDPAVGGLMTVVPNAPTDNTLCIATEEEFLMVMGGKNNPGRIQWCSRRDNTDWDPTEVNSAGGFDLQTDGSIISAIQVQGGILVVTNTDIHLIEYVGPPNYYGRKMISSYSGGVSKNSLAAIPGGAIWLGVDGFWVYDGNVTRLPCDIQHEVFDESRLDLPSRIFMSNNEAFSEIWLFYPLTTGNEATKYAVFNYGDKPHWHRGRLERTAWHGPVHQARPISVSDRTPIQQEVGWLDLGNTRVGTVYAETGGMDLSDGDQNVRLDRITHDGGPQPSHGSQDGTYNFTLKLRQAPSAPERIKGPITPNVTKGYTTVRSRSRQVVFRIDQVTDGYWTTGKIRLRLRPGGAR